MTAAELIALLSELPPDALVLVDGCEGGFEPAGCSSVIEVQELRGLPRHYGQYMRPIVAAELVTEGDWQIMAGRTRPELVGRPRTAVVIGRSEE
jgi:hypothetical protein